MFKLITSSLVLTFILSFNIYSQTREVPEGWKEIKECGVSFLVPKNMKKQRDEAIPIDSCFAGYKNSTMTLGLDNDMYMRQPEETTYESLEIDGFKARLVTEPQRQELYVMSGNGEDARFTFGMAITFKKTDDAPTARKIFESIRFNKQN